MPVALRSREVPVVLDAMQTHGKLALPAFKPEASNQKYSINFPVQKFFPKYLPWIIALSKNTPKAHKKFVRYCVSPPFL